MKKRLLSLFLAVWMIVGMIPAQAFAADAEGNTLYVGDEVGQYATLEEAVAAAQSGDTIELLKDVNLTAIVTVPAGKNITLDLGGKTIESIGYSVFGDEFTDAVLKVCGELTITDSGVGGKICCNAVADLYASCGVYVLGGTLNIEGGTISCDMGDGYIYGVYVEDGTVNISGGKIEVTGNTDHAVAKGVFVLDGTLNIEDGTIKVTGNTSYGVDGEYRTANKVNISGGKIEATGYGVHNKSTVNIEGTANISGGEGSVLNRKTANIKGGTFSGTIQNEGNGAIAISGGKFDKDPSQYVDSDKYQVTTENNWYFVEEKAQPVYVAMIGEQGYETLQAAYEAVNDTNNTITLLKNVDLGDNYLDIRKKVTIDLGGYEISGAGLVFNIYSGGELSISGGTISAGNIGAILWGGKLTATDMNISADTCGIWLASDNVIANIESGNISGSNYGIHVAGGTANISGGTVSSESRGVEVSYNGIVNISENANISGSYGVYINGDYDPKANITGGTVSGTVNGVYVQSGNATITGGTVSGNNGLSVEANGTATIAGGTVTGGISGAVVYGELEITGGTVTGDTQGVFSRGTVTISGGTVSGEADGVFVLGSGIVDITGGRFSHDPSQFVDLALYQVTTEDNWYVVSEKPQVEYVAQVGEQGFETLQAAYAAVNETNNTITLLKNVDLGSAFLEVNKKLTLDLNGNTINNTYDYTIIVRSDGDLTISSSVEGGTISGGGYGVAVDEGVVTILGGNISARSIGVNVQSGTANIKGGTISGGNNGVYARASGTLNISGGNITSDNNGVLVQSNSTANISENANITSGKYGVYVQANATANIYGGTVSGSTCSVYVYAGTATITGGEAEVTGGKFNTDPSEYVPDTHGVKFEDNWYVVSEKPQVEYVAQVGTQGYESLQAAYDAVNDTNNTITLLKDVDLGDNYLEIGKKVTIDLGGYDVSSAVYAFHIEEGGELTVTGEGTVSGSSYGAFVDGGTVNIESGNISGGTYGVRVYDGTVNIKDGSVEATGSYSNGVYGQGNSFVNIEGGEVSGSTYGVNVVGGKATISGGTVSGFYGAFVDNGKCEIAGGTVSGSERGVYVTGVNNSELKISGGEVSGGLYGVYVYGSNAKADISGGSVLGGIYGVVAQEDCTVNIESGTVSGDDVVAVYGGKVNISGGTVTATSSYGAGVIAFDGKLTISGGEVSGADGVYIEYNGDGNTEVTITGGTVSGTDSGVDAYGGTINVSENANISGGNSGVYVAGGKLDIAGGTVKATGSHSYGVYGYGDAVINIEGGEVSGVNSGVGFYGGESISGKVNVSGGTVSGGSYGVNITDSEATISGGYVSGGYGVIVDGGRAEITGGTVESTSVDGVVVTIMSGGEAEVTGGRFNKHPMYFVPDTHQVTFEDGWYVVSEKPQVEYVAMVGTQGFESLEAALASPLSTNSTITLCKDIKLSTTLNISKKVTIDLGEYDIKSFGNIFEVAANGELLIKGSGTISGDNVVTVTGGKVTVESGNISAYTYGMMVWSGKVTITGGTIYGGYTGIYYSSGEHAISGGSVSGGNFGVYVAGGEVDISGGSVSSGRDINGETIEGVTVAGVNVTGGTVNISGGTISGSTYGVYVQKGTANISGGAIEATSVDGVVVTIMSGGTCVVTGGKFNTDPSQFVPNTHGVTTEDGWFVVSKVTRYNITVGTTVNGTVEVDKTSAKAGEIVTVTVTPMAGYELTNLSYKKNGMSIGIMGNSFAMPTGDVEIVATFKALPTYRIVMPSTFKGGTVTVDDKEAYAGQEVTVTAAANEGYELVFVSVMTAKGTQITLTDGKFTMPAEVVMIAAAFKEKASYVAQVGEQKFESLQAAIDAAEDGDEIVLLSDITLTADDTMVIDGSIIGVFVTDKNIALDMNGKTISVDLTGMTGTIIPFATVRDGHLTINDTVGSGKITATGAKAYALFSAYNPASKLTINGGAFELAEAADCLIHANANEAVVVNGGTFTLDNVGTGNNYQPWIFNVNGKNASHVIVNGGTYNSDVNHQFWGNEVMVPETLAVKDNGDGTWTVTEAEAYIVEIGTSQHSAERKIGYATLADAIASVEKNVPETTIVLLKDVKVSGQYIGHSYAQKIVLDLNGKTLSSADRTLNVHRGGTEVLIKNGTVTGNTSAGTIQVSGGAKLTLENATIKSGSKAKAIKINKDGTLVINDASVKVQGGLDDLIVETGAQTLISAGTFNHDVSDYCVEEYGAVKNTDGTYTVKRVILVENVTAGGKYETVAAAIAAIGKNAGVQELKLLGDVTVKGQFIGHSYAQQVVIDLNGFKMSSTDKALTVYRAGTEVTIKNGTVHGNSTGGTIQVTYGGKLTLGENVTITSGGSANALKVDSPATLIIDNDTVKVQGGKNDLIVADGAKVEISAGYFKHPVAEAWCAEGKMPNPVKTADGWYTVMDAGAAVINGKAYETLHDAFAAVKNGETIKVMKNIDLANEETVTLAEQYKTYFKVEGKSVTIDLNGKTISGTAGNADNMLVGVFSTENDGHLTITGEGTVDVQDGGKVYALIVNYEDGCSIVIENGTYKLDAASDSLIYCGAGYAEGTEGILVQDGTFHLGNLGKGPNGNGSPWIFNVYHKNQNHIMVNGGTFNADVNHQFWANEVFVPETLALKDNDNGTWTVVEAAGYVVEIGVSQHSRERKVGYVDLAAFEGEDVLGNKDGEYFVTGAGSLKQFAEEVGGEVKLENSNIAMTEDITVAENKELLMESDSKIAFNGGGNTITANGTGTKAGESYDYGYVGFIPANKEAATVENVTVTGSGFVEVGHHGTSMGGDYTINNLTVKDLIATLAINNGGNNIAAAFSHYGNAEMTDCVMTGTTTLKEGFKAYDAAFVNTTKTVMSGCTFGKIYLANQAHVTITNTVIDVIDSYAISTRNLGKLVIGAGAEIGVINLYDTGSYKATLVIEEGANVGAIVYNGVTYTAAEWMAR